MTDETDDGVALQATSHTFEAFDEAMIKAGVAAFWREDREVTQPEAIVKAVFRAMYMAMPHPEDISEESLERAYVDLDNVVVGGFIRGDAIALVAKAIHDAAVAVGEREIGDMHWATMAEAAIRAMQVPK